MYNGGVKGSNVGFAKVDSRNGQCKIAVNIKGLELSNGKSEKVYLFYRKQEKILGIYIGSFQVVNGMGEFQEQFQTQNIKAANLSLDEMNGIFIREEDRNERVFASGWDDYAILVDQFCVHKGNETFVSNKEESGMLRASEVEEKRKEPVIFFDRNWRNEEFTEEQPAEPQQKALIQEEVQTTEAEGTKNTPIETINTEIETTAGIDDSAETIQTVMQEIESQVEETTEQEIQNKPENDYGRGTKKQQEDLERGIKRGQKMDTMQKEKEVKHVDYPKKEEQAAEPSEKIESVKTEETSREQELEKGADGVETVIIEDVNGERNNKKIHMSENKVEANQHNQQNPNNMQENGLLWGVHTPGVWKEMSWEEYQEKEQQLRKQVQTCIYQNKGKQDTAKQENLTQAKKEWKGENEKQPEVSDTSNIEETAWEKLCHQFPKIRAFVDEPESLCLKIDLQDLRMLSQENWVLGSNSFLLHGYYNFRYLILTQEEEGFVLGLSLIHI